MITIEPINVDCDRLIKIPKFIVMTKKVVIEYSQAILHNLIISKLHADRFLSSGTKNSFVEFMTSFVFGGEIGIIRDVKFHMDIIDVDFTRPWYRPLGDQPCDIVLQILKPGCPIWMEVYISETRFSFICHDETGIYNEFEESLSFSSHELPFNINGLINQIAEQANIL